MRTLYSIVLLGIALMSCGQSRYSPAAKIMYSSAVKDSFEIYITAPPGADTMKDLSVLYYLDANLRSGKKLREMIALPAYSERVSKTVFVGIGHIGDFHELRRRDFILPGINGNDTTGASVNYGQTENFYRFLKTGLIPMIDSTYKTNTAGNSILGHSLGGLFTFYCLFKNDTLFRKYYALSPSLWVDNYSIYKFNRLSTDSSVKKYLYFSSGSLEIFNRIKAGTNEMNDFLLKQKYPALTYKYQVHDGKTHNSQVESSLDYLLKQN